MSFSKAKLNRYYDEISCAPPPGKYDPKFDSKVKGVILDKGKRFSSPKMENASSMESLDSCCSSKTPIFRTPMKAVQKRGPMSTPRAALLKSRIPLPDKLMPNQISETEKRLFEEINELTRVNGNQLMEKDEEIASLMEKVNSLNDSLNTILYSKAELKNKSEYEMEINKLRKENIDLLGDLEKSGLDYTKKREELESHISALEENIMNHVSINRKLEETLVINSTIFEEINSTITSISENFNCQLEKFVESVTKVEDINKKLMEDYQETLEEFRNESDENLLNKRLLTELQENIDNCRDDLAYAVKRCKTYEIIQTQTSKTINVLSKTLMEREMEVDQLNDIQQEFIEKKNKLEEHVKILSEENKTLKDSFDSFQDSVRLDVEVMHNQLQDKIDSYKQIASEELEKQRLCIAEKQNTIDMLLKEIDYYKNMKTEMNHQLVFSQTKNSNFQEEISSLKVKMTEIENDFQEKIGAQRALFSHLSCEYESLKIASTNEKLQLEKNVAQLNENILSLEEVCLDKDKEISIMAVEMEKTNHQLSQDKSRIKHLVDLSLEYDCQIDNITAKYNDEIKKKNERIENLNKLNMKIKSEKHDVAESLALKLEEYSTIKNMYEKELKLASDLKRDLNDIQHLNQKYIDEVISELVLEKERVSELSNSIETLKTEKADLVEGKEATEHVIATLRKTITKLKHEVKPSNEEYVIKLEQTLAERTEEMQLFEYERIAQALSHEEFLDQKDELLKTIERQNLEIETLSDIVDRHYATIRKLEQDITKITEEKDQLKDTGTEDSMKVTSLEARIADLECRNRELTDIIGPFKSQLVQFDLERNSLLLKKENTEKELRALELEHAKSLGHQNHKQKIKHIVNLNETIANLKKEMEKYRLENIKLKLELTSRKPSTFSSAKKNKENKATSDSRVNSTGPAQMALKDRNG